MSDNYIWKCALCDHTDETKVKSTLHIGVWRHRLRAHLDEDKAKFIVIPRCETMPVPGAAIPPPQRAWECPRCGAGIPALSAGLRRKVVRKHAETYHTKDPPRRGDEALGGRRYVTFASGTTTDRAGRPAGNAALLVRKGLRCRICAASKEGLHYVAVWIGEEVWVSAYASFRDDIDEGLRQLYEYLEATDSQAVMVGDWNMTPEEHPWLHREGIEQIREAGEQGDGRRCGYAGTAPQPGGLRQEKSTSS